MTKKFKNNSSPSQKKSWKNKTKSSASFYSKSRKLNFSGGKVFNTKVIDKNIATLQNMFVSRSLTTGPTTKLLIPVPKIALDYCDAFRSHCNLDIEFVASKEERITKVNYLNKKLIKQSLHSIGVCFTGGVDSTWIIVKLLMDSNIYYFDKLYLFFISSLNGHSSVREKVAVHRIYDQLLEQFPGKNIELVIIEKVEVPVNKKFNLDSKNTYEITSKNQFIILEVLKYCYINSILLKKIYYNCDIEISTYLSDNTVSYTTFQRIILALFNNSVVLEGVLCDGDSDLIQKNKKINLLQNYDLFGLTSFCQTTYGYGTFQKRQKELLKKSNNKPFHHNSCGGCTKCLLYMKAMSI